MSEEVYYSRSNHKKHVSLSKIRQQQKKALQSYKLIDTIKKKAMKEANIAHNDAEETLNKFILSWDDNNGK